MFFFFNDTATTEIYTLSLHDALPIYIDIDIDDVGDVFDDLDVDLDIRPDLDLHKQKVKKSKVKSTGGSDQYFKSGVERQKAMTDTADPLLDDYVEEEKT